ncbi:MAG: SH3 domain-containing protein, partial [Clostridia bacterium]|nr:SH3 domain-containing protein [Clostridia bacterium]
MKKSFFALLLACLTLCWGCGLSVGPAESTSEPTALPTSVSTEETSTEPSNGQTEISTPEPTPVPTEAPTPEPTAEPSATPLVTSLFKSRVNVLNLREKPDTSSRSVGKLGFEETVEVIDAADADFLRVLYKGNVCYCSSKYLVPANEELYGYVAPMYEYERDKNGNIVYQSDGKTPVTLTSELIDVRLIIPDITVYQIFGTSENFTGQVLYTR